MPNPKIRISKLLREHLDEAYMRARLRRTRAWPSCEAFLTEILVEFEDKCQEATYISASILSVADLLHPFHDFALQTFLNCDMRHGSRG